MPSDPRPIRDLTTRAIPLRPETLDKEGRSVEATIATEDPVTVLDWTRWELIDEVLRMDGASLPAQLSLLDSHSRWSLDDVLGSAREFRTESGQAAGRIYFADDERSLRAWGKVRDGHVKDVSVGYSVTESIDIPAGQTATVKGRQYTAGKRTLRVTTGWLLREVSLTAVGADPRAKTREAINPNPEIVPMNPKLRKHLETLGLRAEASDADAEAFLAALPEAQRCACAAMRDPPAAPAAAPAGQAAPAIPAARAESPPPLPAAPPAAAPAEPVAAERQRVTEIEQLAADHDVPAELRRRAIAEGWSVDRSAREFLSALRGSRQAGAAAAAPYHQTGSAMLPHQAGVQSVRALAAAALAGQGLDPTKHAMHTGRRDIVPSDRISAQDAEQGHRYRSMSGADLFRECLRLDTGHWSTTIEHAMELARETQRSAPSGGSLSYVFSTNVYAKLMQGWETIGDTTVGWCDEEDVANFLQQEDISFNADARLKRLAEGGTATHAVPSDSHETYKIARYAKQFVVDEQAVINDRLGAIMAMPIELGENARNLRPDLVYALMLANPTLVADNGAVFNVTAVTTAGGHANLGTAALSSDALKAAITAMVQQRLNRTASNPGRQLNIRPRFLIVPAALEWTAAALTASAVLAKLFADSSDPWYSQLNLIAREGIRVVIDDRIGAIGVIDPTTDAARTGLDTNWFLTSGGRKGLRVAYRRGTNRSPQMRSFLLDRGQWGMGWDINLDIGAAFMDFRPWYKSTGAA